MEYELPQGWEMVTLSDICEVERGITFPASEKSSETSKDSIACLRTANVQETVVWGNLIYVPKHFVKSERKLVCQNDILISMANSRELVGKVSFVTYLPTESTFGAFIAAIRVFSGTDPKFLFYFLRFDETLKKLRKTASQTVNIANLSLDDIYATTIPLAPSNEQHRIVAAIEQQFSRLDAAVTSLQHARAKLKRQRAAILKAAVEGTLTADWRAQHPVNETAEQLLQRILHERRVKWEAEQLAKMQTRGMTPKDDKWKDAYRELEPPDTTNLPVLPERWVWAGVEQVGEVQLGRQRAPQYHTGPYMRPYLRVANVFEDRIDTSDVLTMNFTPEEYEIYRLKYGDILLNEGQSLELIGRPAMYRDEIPGACFQNTLIRFRACSELLPQYALTVFRVYLHTKRFQRIGKHTTNIAHLGAGRFAELEFPLPPLAEQQQIVSEVEARLSIIAQTELEVEANLKRAERLRQTILAQAFAGRLVPQDPDDESASVLLERIRREREKRDEMRKRGRGGNGNGRSRAAMSVPDAEVKIDVQGVEQVELWESVGGAPSS